MYAIIVWEECPAGLNIKECLLELYDFKETGVFGNHPVYSFGDNVKLYTIKERHIFAEDLDKEIDADVFIFATTHRSEKGVHSLSCHVPGNWSKAQLGGKDKEICVAPALLLKKAYLEMKKYSEELADHEITMEVTHHGPYMEKPCIFIEIGSTEEHWGNRKAGEVIAHTIVKLVDGKELENQKIALGIGGPHYANNFNKILERTNIATGHICPKYNLENLDEDMVKKAISRTKEKVDLVILDWKGLGQHKERIKGILEKISIEYKRTDKLK
jgi:D-aminoacyl-tRNA deacylase